MAVTIRLEKYGQSFELPKKWILETLPESILASALEEDANATCINIPTADVTPDDMVVLLKLSQEIEPLWPVPSLRRAHRYLNVPSILPYADPLYDLVPKFGNINAPEHTSTIHKIIAAKSVPLYKYLLAKGYQPDDREGLLAAYSGSIEILELLLGVFPDMPLAGGELLQQAVRNGQLQMVKFILTNIGVGNSRRLLKGIVLDAIDAKWLDGTQLEIPGHPEIVRVLLAEPFIQTCRVDTGRLVRLEIDELGAAMRHGNIPIIRMYLDDAKMSQFAHLGVIQIHRHMINSSLITYLTKPEIQQVFLQWAVKHNAVLLTRFLLSQGMDPSANDNAALMTAASHQNAEIVGLLLTDPRVRQKLHPLELAAYEEQFVMPM